MDYMPKGIEQVIRNEHEVLCKIKDIFNSINENIKFTIEVPQGGKLNF